MTKDFLHKKLQIGDKNSPLGKEIELAEDLGASVSISPSYLFYYSADTGCQYIKTAQLTRIYAEIRIRRYSTSYLIFETKEKRRIKIRGQVDFLRARTVCDALCPHVLIGEEGREMDREELWILYRKRKRVLLFTALFLLCWTVAGSLCIQAEAWIGAAVTAVGSITWIIVAVVLIRSFKKH